MIRLAQMTGFLNLVAVQNSERAPSGSLGGVHSPDNWG
jgi:hypothetical protein